MDTTHLQRVLRYGAEYGHKLESAVFTLPLRDHQTIHCIQALNLETRRFCLLVLCSEGLESRITKAFEQSLIGSKTQEPHNIKHSRIIMALFELASDDLYLRTTTLSLLTTMFVCLVTFHS